MLLESFDGAQKYVFYKAPTRKHEWISSLLRNHHYVIYASKPNKAVAFETALLEQDDNSKKSQ
jgi:hypothetical protein